MTTQIGKVLKKRWYVFFLALLVSVGVYGVYKPLPGGIGEAWPVREVSDDSVRFLVDETYLTQEGEQVAHQEIFDEVLELVSGAREYILVDMFLWNPFRGKSTQAYRPLSQQLTDALVAKKKEMPNISITVISDPINTVYDGQQSSQFEALRAAGITVVLTDHSKMRDSNPIYSSLWRVLLQWPDVLHSVLVGEPYTFRWLPNVMDQNGEQITLRSYLKLFNFKANHRKLIVADTSVGKDRGVVTLITSANPHDGSSKHSNVALRIEGGVWQDVIRSEQAVAEFSGATLTPAPSFDDKAPGDNPVSVSLITEKAIADKVLEMLRRASAGDDVELAVFYLSLEEVIEALIEASDRGARVRVILDPNKDAFGMEKNGVPNRSVAARLLRESDGKIQLKWCATHGEQCHTKMLIVSSPDRYALTLGSANYTRRNLMNLNLESNLYLESGFPSTALVDARAYFDRMWNNADGRLYTLDYEAYKDDSLIHPIQSWVMETSGLSTF